MIIDDKPQNGVFPDEVLPEIFNKIRAAELLHFIAVKNGQEFHYHEKTEFDARTKAFSELGACSDFYQVEEKN